LEQLIQSKNLNKNIVLSGYIDSQYIASVFGIMDIYLHVASYEPFGFVIPEAMVNGIPVISSRTGSALDAIEHKKSGYLLQSRTKSEVVSGIVFMLNSDRKSIGWEGKIIAQNKYSFERMWDNYIQLYEQVLINKNS
jgi:glycosyltransferase involved in cell wall biosynthesis